MPAADVLSAGQHTLANACIGPLPGVLKQLFDCGVRDLKRMICFPQFVICVWLWVSSVMNMVTCLVVICANPLNLPCAHGLVTPLNFLKKFLVTKSCIV